MISPWKFGWLNPRTINWTGPMAMTVSSPVPGGQLSGFWPPAPPPRAILTAGRSGGITPGE
jgi:hypothetical protein